MFKSNVYKNNLGLDLKIIPKKGQPKPHQFYM